MREFLYVCGVKGLENVIYFAVLAVKVIQIAAPIALIIWGSLDFLKGIIAADNNKIIAARKPFIQRLISAVLIFMIPWLTDLTLNALADTGNAWAKCYAAAAKSK